MPKILFTRTPSEAEGGPGHDFAEGQIYDVSARSARRWFDLGFAVEPPRPQIITQRIGDGEIQMRILPEPVSIEAFEAAIADGSASSITAVETGGQAPPVIVPLRHIRHAASGKWHVYEGERRLTDRAIPKEEAQAMADARGTDDRVLDAEVELGDLG